MATPRPKIVHKPISPKPQQNLATSAHPAPTQPLTLTLTLTQPHSSLQKCMKQSNYALLLARPDPPQTKKRKTPTPTLNP